MLDNKRDRKTDGGDMGGGLEQDKVAHSVKRVF